MANSGFVMYKRYIHNEIAVTGASGLIGSSVCQWLEANRIKVRRLSRYGTSRGTIPLDLSISADNEQWFNALNGCSTVIHCAAHVHRPVEDKVEKLLFEAVNVNGTDKLLKACSKFGIGDFVLASTSAVYDWTLNQSMNENGVLRATTAYALSKLHAEGLVKSSGLNWRIARIATVYGTGDRANFYRLAQALRKRRFVIPGNGNARKSVLNVNMAGELLGRLTLDPRANESVINLGSPYAVSLNEICDAFCRCCRFPIAVKVPIWLLKTTAKIGDITCSVKLPSPITTDTLNKLTNSTVLQVGKMLELYPDIQWPSFEKDLASFAEYYAAY